jgi:hypothetical protein
MFSNHKIIILPTLVIRISNLEIFLFCQHNSTSGGNLELRQTISIISIIIYYSIAVITFYLLRPLKLTNQNQSQIQSVQLFITFAT